ncbi:MAG: carboxypeptidase-like regulatory domain-containing protein [Planctomycetota bacterium]
MSYDRRVHSLIPCLLVAFAAAQEPIATEKAVDASSPANATIKLSGRVLTWQGTPVPGAGVVWGGADSLTTAELVAKAAVRSGDDGRFVIDVPSHPQNSSTVIDNPTLMIAAKGYAAIQPAVTFKIGAAEANSDVRPRIDTDLGDVVLPEGVRLFGRVRDQDGKGIAGASVVARDLLDGNRVLPGPTSQCRCRAVTDQSGIFELPGTLASGVAIEVQRAGYLRYSLAPAGVGTPLEMSLQPSGKILGRVLDEDGRGVGNAIVSVSYERRGKTSRVHTSTDGAFELPIDHVGRFRLRATRVGDTDKKGKPVMQHRDSELFEGPVANLELQFEKPSNSNDAKASKLKIQAVSAKDGTPVTGLRAAATWQQHAMQNANYLEYLLGMNLPAQKPSTTNEVEVDPPAEQEPRTGAVRVMAKGFAPMTNREVEWAEVEEGATRPPLVVQLVPESTISGRVVDETSGAPIAGASIWAMVQQDPTQGIFNAGRTGPPANAVTSAADGTYSLGELGEGTWVVRFVHKDRPTPPSMTVELKAEEQKTDVLLKLPEGARVSGRVTGMPIPQGSKIFLHPITMPRFGGNSFSSFSSAVQKPDSALPLQTDGSFEFTGVALANFILVVDLPSPPRCGGSLAVPLEPVRVRRSGIQRDFDGSADVPGTIRGKVTFSQATPTECTLVVVAEQAGEDPNEQIFGNRTQIQGPRAFVQPDGTFRLGVVAGFHRLRLVDAWSGMLLASGSDRVEVKAGGEATLDIDSKLTEVAIALQQEVAEKPMAVVDRIEVRFTPKADPKAQGRALQVFGGNDNYDQGAGIDVPAGATSARLWLPEGSVLLLARNNVTAVRVDKDRFNQPPLGREEFEIAKTEGSRREVTLKIGPPPEVPEAEVEDEEGKGKGQKDK